MPKVKLFLHSCLRDGRASLFAILFLLLFPFSPVGATSYTGPTGIVYSDFLSVGLNPVGEMDIFVDCSAHSGAVNSWNETLYLQGSAHACTGSGNSFWLQYQMALFTTSNLDPVPDGLYNIQTNGHATSSANQGQFLVTNHLLDDGTSDPCDTGPTRICDENPYDGLVISATSTSETVTIDGFVVDSDVRDGDDIEFVFDFYRNENRVLAGPLFAFSGSAPNSEVITMMGSTGYNHLSTTTSAFTRIGKYTGRYSIKVPYFSLFGIGIGKRTLASKAVTFTVGTSTPLEILIDDASGPNSFLANATSTDAVKAHCNILVSFDFFDCTMGLVGVTFTPNPAVIENFTAEMQGYVLNRFPMGYFYDFVTIVSTSTASSLTVISATVPNGIAGSGSHIDLDLTGVLDPILNATTSTFTNASATSSETLFVITNRYWTYLIYLLTVIYLLSRIIGKHVVPTSFKQLS